MKTHIPKKKGQDNNYYVICANLNGMSLLDSSPIIGLNCLLHTRACWRDFFCDSDWWKITIYDNLNNLLVLPFNSIYGCKRLWKSKSHVFMDRICGLKGTKSCKPRLLKGPLPPPRWTAGQVWRSLQRCFPAFATPGFSSSTPRTTTIWSASSSATRTTRTSMHSHRQWQGRARCVRIKVPTYNFLLEF